MSINEEFGFSFITDILEGSNLGSVYINPNMESSENSAAKYSVLKNCFSLNRSIVVEDYATSGAAGCADLTSMIPPTYGGMYVFGATNAQQNGAGSFVAPSNNASTATMNGGVLVNGAPGRVVGIEQSITSLYDISLSYSNGATNTTMGIGWNWRGYWDVLNNTQHAMRYIYPGGANAQTPYTGYAGTSAFMIGIDNGLVLGGEGDDSRSWRQLSMAPVIPTNALHLQGDYSINTAPVPGSNSAWINESLFQTTTTAPVAVSDTTIAVTACPTAAIPGSTRVMDAPPASAVPVMLGTYTSCTANVMTISASAKAVASGDTIKITAWAPTGGLVGSLYPAVITGGACSGSSLVGGLLNGSVVAGTFVGATCTSSNYIINSLPVAAHGWNCSMIDRTTPADILTQSPSTGNSTTAAQINGTTVASDVIGFTCAPF